MTTVYYPKGGMTMLKALLLLAAVLAFLYFVYCLYRLIKTWSVKDEKTRVNPWLVRGVVSLISTVLSVLGLCYINRKGGEDNEQNEK